MNKIFTKYHNLYTIDYNKLRYIIVMIDIDSSLFQLIVNYRR